MAMKLITGNTFPVKDKLKELGGKWDPDSKGWKVPDDKEKEALDLVSKGNSGGGTTSVVSKQSYRPSKCKECGCSPSRYVKIYRSGICSNCYRDEKEEREMGY